MPGSSDLSVGVLVTFFSIRRPGPLVEDLRRALAELDQLAADDLAARQA
jgi:hypothetical protein